jgi:hypothetical protein
MTTSEASCGENVFPKNEATKLGFQPFDRDSITIQDENIGTRRSRISAWDMSLDFVGMITESHSIVRDSHQRRCGIFIFFRIRHTRNFVS